MRNKLLTSLLLIAAVIAATTACGNTSQDTSSDDVIFADYDYDASKYVTLGQYKGFVLNLDDDYEVTDEDVIADIESQLSLFPYYEKLNKTKVENGDYVNITYTGSINGEENESLSGEDIDLQIGSRAYDFFTGENAFENGLIGKNVGDKVLLKLTFSDDYIDDEVSGKEVEFNITINQIENQIYYSYADLTDKIVDEIFAYDTVEEYFENEKEYLVETAEAEKEEAIQISIMDMLIEHNTVELPDGLVDQRVEEYIKQYEDMCAENNTTLSVYLSLYYGLEEDEFRQNVKEQMQESLEEEFILQAIADKEGIVYDEEGFNEYIDSIVEEYGYDDKEEVIDTYGEEYIKRDYVLFNKTFNFVRDNSVIE